MGRYEATRYTYMWLYISIGVLLLLAISKIFNFGTNDVYLYYMEAIALFMLLKFNYIRHMEFKIEEEYYNAIKREAEIEEIIKNLESKLSK